MKQTRCCVIRLLEWGRRDCRHRAGAESALGTRVQEGAQQKVRRGWGWWVVGGTGLSAHTSERATEPEVAAPPSSKLLQKHKSQAGGGAAYRLPPRMLRELSFRKGREVPAGGGRQGRRGRGAGSG